MWVKRSNLPDDCGVFLEYGVPVTDYRIDCILSGKGHDGCPTIIIFELKGWESAESVDIEGEVRTLLGHEMTFTCHPSYQANWYRDILEDYERVVQDGQVKIKCCAYLYNCVSKEVICDKAHEKYTTLARPFCKGEEKELLIFINGIIDKGDNGEAMRLIENSPVLPSRRLLDSIDRICNGEDAFHLSPAQQSDFNRILRAIRYADENKVKVVLAIQGKPGTGKSVMAILLLFAMLRQENGDLNDARIRYITKTIAPRHALKEIFIDLQYDGAISNLLSSPNGKQLNIAIVDEAHRLMAQQSEDQAEAIIKNSNISVFFHDPKQIVSVWDAGTTEHFKQMAVKHHAKFRELEPLTGQFRCGITDWVEYLLKYPDASPVALPNNYEIKYFDSPTEMLSAIRKKDSSGLKSRIVAGYTRKFQSRNKPDAIDWDMSESGFDDFKLQWNMIAPDAGNWATRQGVDRIGCIHRAQGMEFEGYVGVILSKDIDCDENGCIVFHPENHSKDDDQGISKEYCKKMSDLSSDKAQKVAELIRNTYYVLLTRGMRGCYIYAENEGMANYVKQIIQGK